MKTRRLPAYPLRSEHALGGKVPPDELPHRKDTKDTEEKSRAPYGANGARNNSFSAPSVPLW